MVASSRQWNLMEDSTSKRARDYTNVIYMCHPARTERNMKKKTVSESANKVTNNVTQKRYESMIG